MPHRANLPARIRALCAAVAICAGFAGGDAAAEPYVPADDDLVLERLPAPSAQALRELRDLRLALDTDPEDLGLALRLARRYMDLGRSEADPRYYGYAEAALKPWWDLAMPPVEVLVLRAGLHQSRHDFDAALDRVNHSAFGLQAGVFTRDLYKAQQSWDRLEVGGVIIGDVPNWRIDHMPYGGVKDSGLGREGIRWAIEDMTEVRLLAIRTP